MFEEAMNGKETSERIDWDINYWSKELVDDRNKRIAKMNDIISAIRKAFQSEEVIDDRDLLNGIHEAISEANYDLYSIKYDKKKLAEAQRAKMRGGDNA